MGGGVLAVAASRFWDMKKSASRTQNSTFSTYRALIRDLKPGDYMVWVVAIDEHDASSQSMPVHVAVK
jgi:hypothetical protein